MESLRQLFFKHVAQTSSSPLSLEMIRAEGIFLIDNEGKKYLDLISGISVNNLGHGNHKVVEAIKDQADSHLHLMVYGEFIQSSQVNLAKKVAGFLPSTLSSFYFLSSGAEAVEGAMKLAKRYTGRTEIIAFENAYHGSTQGALSVCGNEELKNSFRPLLPSVKILPFNSIESLKEISNKTAAVIVEPIQGEAGIQVGSTEFLLALRKRCSEAGALLLYDEIQTGLGRTGKLFAFEHDNVIPDVLILGKAFGGGMPLSTFISSDKIMSSLTHHPVLGHITTFGGHPVSCAAALASFDFITSSTLIEDTLSKESLFRKYLQHPLIKEIRGKGLILSLQFQSEDMNRQIINTCIERGVLVDWFLFAADCMRICPPLVITEEEIKQSCGIIIDSINSLNKNQYL
jgi:acetylornithine/N-succinyldiaminopimelate aminotransferase